MIQVRGHGVLRHGFGMLEKGERVDLSHLIYLMAECKCSGDIQCKSEASSYSLYLNTSPDAPLSIFIKMNKTLKLNDFHSSKFYDSLRKLLKLHRSLPLIVTLYCCE